MMSDYGHPKVGDVVRDRTVINVRDEFLIFGQRENDIPNCGAYVTSYREWFAYERTVADGVSASRST